MTLCGRMLSMFINSTLRRRYQSFQSFLTEKEASGHFCAEIYRFVFTSVMLDGVRPAAHCTRLLGPTQKRSCATKKPPWLDHAPVKLVYIFTQLDRGWDKSYMRGCVSSLAGTLICGWPTENYRRKIYRWLRCVVVWCGVAFWHCWPTSVQLSCRFAPG